MSEGKPVYLGQFPAVYRGDAPDQYIDISAELVAGEAIQSVTFALTDSAGAVQEGAVDNESSSGGRVDFRIHAPATPGIYRLTAVFTIDDGQQLTRLADVWVI